MVEGKWFAPGTPVSPEMLSVRRAVFGREEDALDAESWNAVIWADGVPAACGRIWWKEDAFWLGDIGVLQEYRGRGLGDLALRLLLFKAQSHAAREVRLRCAPETEGFFSRLGFRPASGGSGAVEMAMAGSDIDLDTCRNCHREDCPSRH